MAASSACGGNRRVCDPESIASKHPTSHYQQREHIIPGALPDNDPGVMKTPREQLKDPQ